MTAHALDRLAERLPFIDPQIALDHIVDQITAGHAPRIAESVTGQGIHEVRMPTNDVIFAVVAADGGVVTVLTEGMTTPTTLGVIELVRTPVPEPPRPPRPEFEIRTLGPDEKITEPGFYAIDIERHHSQPCDGISVTSGILRKIELETPADVWATHLLNPERQPKKETDALRLGKVMAAYIENGPDGARDHVLVLPGVDDRMTIEEMIALAESGGAPPASKPSKPTFDQVKRYVEGNPTPAGKRAVEFWRRVEADPRMVVSEKEWQTICAMGEALAADPMSSAALGGIPEITIAWRDERYDLWCLSRPDQISFDGMTSDYKRMASQGRPFSERLIDHRITDLGIDMQMAFAAEGMKELTGHWPDAVGIVAQCTEAPYHPVLRSFEEEDLHLAMFRNKRARRTFRECLDSGNWWGPGQHVGSYRRPQWLHDRLVEEMNVETGVAAE